MTGFNDAASKHPHLPEAALRLHRTPSHDALASKLHVSIQPVEALGHSEREAMWLLYERFYGGSSQALFLSDLSEKSTALLLRDAHATLQGFTTMRWWERKFEGAPVRILFSGDTVIDRAHWGTQALAFNWLRFAGALKRAKPDSPLYWFLIVKGQRTYRYLPAFARNFIPHWNDSAPLAWQRLLRELARERFADAYDPVAGVVRFKHSLGHLAPEWAAVSARERSRREVQFFLERNPGYARGDELVCLSELSSENLRPLARRVFEGGQAA